MVLTRKVCCRVKFLENSASKTERRLKVIFDFVIGDENIKLATKRLRSLSMPSNDKLCNHLVANRNGIANAGIKLDITTFAI